MRLPVVVLCFVFFLSACQQDATDPEVYPSKPIQIIVPYGPGGTTDVFARAFARVLSEHLPGSAPVIVVNKPGGSSTIGVTALHRSKADGYTLAMLPTGVLEVQPHLNRVRWTLDDFAPVIGLLEIPAAINVRDDSTLATFSDWLQQVRSQPNAFMYSTSGGVGSSTHLAMQTAQNLLGIKLRWIPFEGEAASRAALLGGKIQGNFSIPTLHKGGELRPLVFLTRSKPDSDLYQDVPTLKQLGFDFEAQFPLGVIAKAGTPKPILKVLHDAFEASMQDPAIRKLYQTYDLAPYYLSSSELGEQLLSNSQQSRQTLVNLGMIR
jgi:tripartite-type tricarboxylate transporter receptor subunit TctC